MKKVMTAAELLKYRRLHGGLEWLRADCTIESTDGHDVDPVLSGRLRAWYVDLLDRGDVRYLAPEDVAGASTMRSVSLGESGSAFITAPENCRRVLAVKLSCWHNPATVLAATELERVMRLQENPYTRADHYTPVAVACGESGREIRVWPSGSDLPLAPRIESMTAVTDPGPGTYVIDESALALLLPRESPVPNLEIP